MAASSGMTIRGKDILAGRRLSTPSRWDYRRSLPQDLNAFCNVDQFRKTSFEQREKPSLSSIAMEGN
jgi:hypothetical protein